MTSPLPEMPRAAMVMAGVATIGGFIFGYDIGEIGGTLGATTFVKQFGQANADGTYALPSIHQALIVSMLLLFALVGALASGPLADKMGRKVAIMIAAACYIVGGIIQITSHKSWVSLMVGRAVCGLGIGAISVVAPMYNAECSPSHIRGRLGSLYQLQATFGIVTAAAVNFLLHARNDSLSWRLPKAFTVFFACTLFVGMLFLPNSPRWMIMAGRNEAALKTIAKLHGVEEDHPVILQEYNATVRDFEEKKAAALQNPAKWHAIFTGERMLFRLFLGCSIMFFQQSSGVNIFFFYGTTLFKSAGVRDPYLTSLIISTINFACTIPSIYVIERYGRRVCLLGGSILTTLSLIAFACVGTFALSDNPADEEKNRVVGIGMVVVTCTYILGFAMAWGPIPWIVVSEIFPPQYNRAVCMGIATSINWLTAFAVSMGTPTAIAAIGFKISFLFTACALLSGVVVYFYLPETKGRSIDEVAEMIEQRVSARKSKQWVPKVRDLATPEEEKNIAFPTTVEVAGP